MAAFGDAGDQIGGCVTLEADGEDSLGTFGGAGLQQIGGALRQQFGFTRPGPAITDRCSIERTTTSALSSSAFTPTGCQSLERT